jgi:hypothetical protein
VRGEPHAVRGGRGQCLVRGGLGPVVWCGREAVSVDVGESCDMVDGVSVGRFAEFADLGGEPGNELGSPPSRPRAVDETGAVLSGIMWAFATP